MTPCLAHIFGFKDMHNDYDRTSGGSGYILTDIGATGGRREFYNPELIMNANNDIWPNGAIWWNRVDGTNQISDWYQYNKLMEVSTDQHWFDHTFMNFYAQTCDDHLSSCTSKAPLYGGQLNLRQRAIATHSNSLIAINHETFDDAGGMLRSGRLLGNTNLYLNLAKADFKRQFFDKYQDNDKTDNDLILNPSIKSLPGGDVGRNVRMDSWVLHHVRAGIEAGGNLVTKY